MRESTPRASVLTRIWPLSQRLVRTAFAASDERAQERGWEVLETGRWSRSYRDPRFDRFRECAECAGDGCGPCDGTGRVAREPGRVR